MMDPKVFGPNLNRLMDGEVDDAFWLSHVGDPSQCQLGAFYVAMRLGERERGEKRARSAALDQVLAALGVPRSWMARGR
jgi:hypothetical protein